MLRCNEYLWRLEKGWLIGKANCSEEMDADAALGASLIPALRASRINRVEALRED